MSVVKSVMEYSRLFGDTHVCQCVLHDHGVYMYLGQDSSSQGKRTETWWYGGFQGSGYPSQSKKMLLGSAVAEGASSGLPRPLLASSVRVSRTREASTVLEPDRRNPGQN